MSKSQRSSLTGVVTKDPPETGNEMVTRLRGLALSLRGTLGVAIGIVVWWELLARSGLFHPLLVPTIDRIAIEFVELVVSGQLWVHLSASLLRLFLGLAIGAALGTALGLLMGQIQFFDEVLVPLVNFLLPIPSLALIPLFMLWFGLGNRSILPLVVFASTLPIAINTWRGIRGIKPVWIRAARSMNVRRTRLFLNVILPGALPLIIAGLRIGFAQAWRSVIAGELVAAATTGLGVIIFRGKQFVNMPLMLSAVVVIGLLSQLFEKVIFARLEHVTVAKWGMLTRSGSD